MPAIDGARVVADLKRLAEFGRYKTGVHRPTYSPVDVASRQWLAEKFARGRARRGDRRHRQRLRPQSGRRAAPAGRLAQRNAALWRLARRRAGGDLRARAGPRLRRRPGLRRARHRGRRLGRRGGSLRQLSRQPLVHRRSRRRRDRPDHEAATGHAAARGAGARRALPGGRANGSSPAAMSAISKRISSRATRSTPPGCASASSRRSSASGTTGSSLTGEQNHAGTTRMVRRKDAGVAMVRLATRIHDRFPEIAGPRTVWTIGRMPLDPNAPSVIPGRAEMQVQFRDADSR